MNFNITFEIALFRDAVPTLTPGLSRCLLSHTARQSAPKTPRPSAHRPDSMTRSGPCAPPPSDSLRSLNARARRPRARLHPDQSIGKQSVTPPATPPRRNKSHIMRAFVEDSSHARLPPRVAGPLRASHNVLFCSGATRRALKGASLSVPLGP